MRLDERHRTKKTPQIEKLAPQVEEELWTAEYALRVICEAGEFLDPNHLAGVNGWLNAHRNTSGTATLSDRQWEIRESGKTPVILALGFETPCFEFIDLRA